MGRKHPLGRGLYVITDCERLSNGELILRTQQILEAGVAALQYRNKTSNENRMETGLKPFIVNDDVELAKNLQADGIHLGRDDYDYRVARESLGEDIIIGVSCYNDMDRALDAQSRGVDYIAFGAIYPTASKTNTVHASLDLIRTAKQKLDIPVAAIGGITPDNCAPLVESGVDLLAVISSIYQAQDPGETVNKFNKILYKIK